MARAKAKENAARTEKILEKIKKQIAPDMSVVKKVDKIVAAINSTLKRKDIAAQCVKGGSIAKETFLKNDHDADLFIRFDEAFRGQSISDMAGAVVKESLPKADIRRIHGSRDYFQFRHQGVDYEIIPVIYIDPKDYKAAQNVTDLSPEHVTWVRRYTSKRPHLTDEIRLTKRFCKAAGVYGAESYINGFSGHIVDILVIHYGSFMRLVEEFSKVDPDKDQHIIIDHEHHLKDPLKELNASKISPLIVVDPIQKDRNAAAALSKEKLRMFIDACKRFLQEPSEEFFRLRRFSLEREINAAYRKVRMLGGFKSVLDVQKNTYTTIIDIETLEGSKDIVGTKVLKVFEILHKQITMHEFDVLYCGWHFDFKQSSAVIYCIIRKTELSRFIEQQGPPLTAPEDYRRFKDKHISEGHKVFDRENRAYALVPRKYLEPRSLLADLFKKDFISNRVKRIGFKDI